ncbi:MAG: Rnf-Nqr domain containing protein, partial [Gammaproteobacteria bacterium]
MTDFFSTFSHAALQDNLVLIQLLGVSAFIAGSGRLRPAMELSQLMFLVLVIACMANLAWHHLVLQPLGLSALQLPVFATTGAMIATATYGL